MSFPSDIGDLAVEIEQNIEPLAGAEVWTSPDGRTVFGVIDPDGKHRQECVFYVCAPGTKILDAPRGEGLAPTNALGCILRPGDMQDSKEKIIDTARRFLAGERGCLNQEAR